MFESLVEIVVDGGHGVRAYNSCAKAARARISSEPDNAAALTLIMFAAQGVVEAYDDQPLPIDAADALLDNFRGMVATLDAAYADGTGEAKLAALNAVSVQLVEAAKN
ncbi:MAG: hypothetical protein CML67_04365 [Rhodobacteraceae bacterium]|uniref:hypothetical protein n=1 Tax=Stappia TaxID=152161 RepID=UPI000C551CA4|nr:hypothetical protein [Stappia stellulata]MBB98757.1 hypothetical protein [Paracoccaceae bacterium]MBL6431908.1 hypothetical protein [Alphaproteobacteria bacterium]MCA1241649.1 hypothetical protein [Stappia stellulata]